MISSPPLPSPPLPSPPPTGPPLLPVEADPPSPSTLPQVRRKHCQYRGCGPHVPCPSSPHSSLAFLALPSAGTAPTQGLGGGTGCSAFHQQNAATVYRLLPPVSPSNCSRWAWHTLGAVGPAPHQTRHTRMLRHLNHLNTHTHTHMHACTHAHTHRSRPGLLCAHVPEANLLLLATPHLGHCTPHLQRSIPQHQKCWSR